MSATIEDLLAAVYLAADGHELTGRDLLAAGVVSGRWQQLESELAAGIGLIAAEAPPDAEVSEHVRLFRLDRGLLSAEDVRAWMQPRGLTMAALKAAAARAVARGRGGEPEPVAVADVEQALPAEAICTGALVDIGMWLADRMLSATTSGVEVEPLPLERTSVQRLVFEEARTIAGATTEDAGRARGERLAWMAALDDAHRDWEAAATAAPEVARRLHEKELAWCRFELDELRLVSQGAAAEAARQLADGTNASAVAAAAGVAVRPQRLVLADAPSQLAQKLAGAVVGDVAGPWSDGEDHVVARVRERRPPNVEDDQIVARAREELMADAGARLRAGRVRWFDRS